MGKRGLGGMTGDGDVGTRGIKRWDGKGDSARGGQMGEKIKRRRRLIAGCVRLGLEEWFFLLYRSPADLRKDSRDPKRRPRTRVGTWRWGEEAAWGWSDDGRLVGFRSEG
jgi:hypothetical protein